MTFQEIDLEELIKFTDCIQTSLLFEIYYLIIVKNK